MVGLETLECRRNAAENELYELGARLGHRLHAVEEEIERLHETAHALVCRSGRVPTEVKTVELARLLRTALGNVDLREAGRVAVRMKELKATVFELETEIDRRLRGHEVDRHASRPHRTAHPAGSHAGTAA